MWSKVNKSRVGRILEPSAGKGDILDYIKESAMYRGNYDLSAIEVDSDLRATLIGKKYRVIESDFLAYSGLDKFDLIIANPPFSSGDVHLLKAMSMMESGQIVFLLNAETLRNPHTNVRKELIRRLEELHAEIEYIPGAFKDAERKTGVEVALIYIDLGEKEEADLFENCADRVQEHELTEEERKDLASRNTVEFMVEKFNAAVHEGAALLLSYRKNRHLFGGAFPFSGKESLSDTYNNFLAALRRSYWKDILDLPEVKTRMTTAEIKRFNEQIEAQSNMDFTERNIREFVLSIIGNYEKTLTRAVAELFDTFTQKYHWHEECAKNIHYFNGWKTNASFFVNKKVIIPYRQMQGYYGQDIFSRGKLSWDLQRAFDDIDLVMNYFTHEPDFVSIASACEKAMAEGISSKIESTHFIITFYKKGTMHMTFRNEDTRRRFNIVACKDKAWIPEDYGRKKYSDMTAEEKSVVKEFEGEESYNRNIGRIGFVKNVLAIEDMTA